MIDFHVDIRPRDLVGCANGTSYRCVSLALSTFSAGSLSGSAHTVDLHLAVSHNLPDLALLLQVLQACPCQRAIDLESVDESGNGNEAVGLNVLVELLGSGLVEEDSVLGLVLDYKDAMSARIHHRHRQSTASPAMQLVRVSVKLGGHKKRGSALTPALAPLLLLLLRSCVCRRHFDFLSCRESRMAMEVWCKVGWFFLGGGSSLPAQVTRFFFPAGGQP